MSLIAESPKEARRIAKVIVKHAFKDSPYAVSKADMERLVEFVYNELRQQYRFGYKDGLKAAVAE